MGLQIKDLQIWINSFFLFNLNYKFILLNIDNVFDNIKKEKDNSYSFKKFIVIQLIFMPVAL